jgi:hypothetical protein
MKVKKTVIVRTYTAGVFMGDLESRTGQEVVLTNARRIWYWSGAASLSQLAMEVPPMWTLWTYVSLYQSQGVEWSLT